MGKKIYDEDLRLNLILNGEGLNNGSKLMVAALGKLEQEMVGSEQKAKELALEIRKLEGAISKNSAELVSETNALANNIAKISTKEASIIKMTADLNTLTAAQARNNAAGVTDQAILKKEQAEINALTQRIAAAASQVTKWQAAQQKLQVSIVDLTATEGQNAGALSGLQTRYNALTQSIRAQQLAIDQMREKVGLAGMTLQQLRNHLNALKVQLANMPGSMGSPMFRALQQEINETNIRIRTLTTGATRLAQAWERVEKAANRAGTIIGWTTVIIYGITRLVSAVTDRMKELEDLVGSTRKNTNLLNSEVWEMKDNFDHWDTRTKTDDLLKLAIVAGKLGIEGKENISKFVDVANKLQIALGDDLQGSVEDTVNSLGKLMNAFRIDKKMPIEDAMLRTGDVLNQLAKSSAASAGTILEYMTRLSAVSELAGFTIDQIGGLGSTLDALHVPSERGATAMQKIMIQLGNPKKIASFAEAINSMRGTFDEAHKSIDLTADSTQTMSAKFTELLKNDPNFVLTKLLEKFVAGRKGMVDMNEGLAEFGVRGQYMTAVLGSIALNLDVLEGQQKIAAEAWEANTSVLSEYNIMNNNFTAEVEKQHKIIRAQTDQMEREAEPAVMNLLKAWTSFVVGVKNATDFIGRHWTAIKNLTMAYIMLHTPLLYSITLSLAETAVLKAKTTWAALELWGLKMKNIWVILTTTNSLLLNEAQLRLIDSSKILMFVNTALCTGFKAAWTEMRTAMMVEGALAATTMAVVGTVLALAAAFYLLVIRHKDLTEAEKRDKEMRKNILDDYYTEKGELDQIIERLNDANISQKERSDLIKKIQDQYGEYLPLLMKEGLTVDDITKNYDKLVDAMGRRITVQRLMETAGKNKADMDAAKAEVDEAQKVYDAAKEKKDNDVFGNIAGILTSENAYNFNKAEKDLKKKTEILQALVALDQKYQGELLKITPQKKERTIDEIVQDWNLTKWDRDSLQAQINEERPGLEARMQMGNKDKNIHQDIINFNAKIDKLNELSSAYVKLTEELETAQNKAEAANTLKKIDDNGKSFDQRQADRVSQLKEDEVAYKQEANQKKMSDEALAKGLKAINIKSLQDEIQDRKDSHRDMDGDRKAFLEAEDKLEDLYRDKTKKKTDKTNKERLDELDAENDEEINKIKLRHLTEKNSEAQVEDDLFNQQLIYYSKKMALYKKDHEAYMAAEKAGNKEQMLAHAEGEKDFQQAALQYVEAQVAAQDKMNALIVKAQKELAHIRITNLNESIEKETALENERWEAEKGELETQFRYKVKMLDDDLAYNRLIQQKIDALKTAHERNINKITQPERDEEVNKVTQTGAVAKQMGGETTFTSLGQVQQFYDGRQDIINKARALESKYALGDNKKIVDINKKYDQQDLELKKEKFDAETKMHQYKMQMLNEYIGALRNAVGAESAMGRALFVVQQGIAVADVWIKTYASNAAIGSLATAQIMAGDLEAPARAAALIAANNANAVLQTGLIALQSVAEVAQWAEGLYPRVDNKKTTVMGANDGRVYSAVQGGAAQTGIYSRPTLLDMAGGRSLVGEKAPEMVIDGATFRRLQINAPELLQDIYAYAGKGPIRKQNQAGSYAVADDFISNSPERSRGNDQLVIAINRLNAHLDKGVKATVAGYGQGSVLESLKNNANLYKSLTR